MSLSLAATAADFFFLCLRGQSIPLIWNGVNGARRKEILKFNKLVGTRANDNNNNFFLLFIQCSSDVSELEATSCDNGRETFFFFFVVAVVIKMTVKLIECGVGQ